jgi:hypothetical protein
MEYGRKEDLRRMTEIWIDRKMREKKMEGTSSKRAFLVASIC